MSQLRRQEGLTSCKCSLLAARMSLVCLVCVQADGQAIDERRPFAARKLLFVACTLRQRAFTIFHRNKGVLVSRYVLRISPP